jgi:hypothetical protein
VLLMRIPVDGRRRGLFIQPCRPNILINTPAPPSFRFAIMNTDSYTKNLGNSHVLL